MKEVHTDQYSWKQKTMNNLVLPGSFAIRTSRRLGEIWATLPFEFDELMVHVSNKLKLLDVAINRNSTFFGRMYNKITGEELDFVVMDGIAVKQLFDMMGEEPPMPVDLKSQYRVGHEDLRRWYKLVEDAKSSSDSSIAAKSESN